MINIVEHDSSIKKFLGNKATKQKLMNYFSFEYENKLLDYLLPLEFSLREPLTNNQLSKDIIIEASVLSEKTKPEFNGALKEFCREHEIDPPIQLYFRTKKVNVKTKYKGAGYSNVGAHFACSRLNRDHASGSFISTDELRSILMKAGNQIETEKSMHFSNSSPFMTIEKRLEKRPGRYPCLGDLAEEGSYCHNKTYYAKMKKMLQGKQKCLVTGTPGCGKSSLVIAFGYEYAQEGHQVYYLDMTSISCVDDLNIFLQKCDEQDLIIVDNAHANSVFVNDLLCNIFRVKLLLSSRCVSEATTFSRPFGNTYSVSYLRVCHKEGVVLPLSINKKTICGIVDWHSKRKGLSSGKIGNVDAIIDKCKGSYHILNFYIEAWHNSDNKRSLSDVEEKEIFSDIFIHYLKECPCRHDLLKFSAVSQYEIDLEQQCIEGDMGELLKDGYIVPTTIEEVASDRYISQFRVYHPTIAEYFIKAEAYMSSKYINDTNNFIFKSICEYLKARPFFFFKNMYQIFLHDESLFKKLIAQEELNNLASDILRKEITSYRMCDIEFIFRFIILAKNGDSKLQKWLQENFYEPLENYLNKYEYHDIPINILSIAFHAIDNLDVSNEFLLALDFSKLSRQMNESYGNFSMCSFITDVLERGISKDQIKSLNETFDFTKLGQLLQNSNACFFGISHFVRVSINSGVSNDCILRFCEQFNFNDLCQSLKGCYDGIKLIPDYYDTLIELGTPVKHACRYLDSIDLSLMPETGSGVLAIPSWAVPYTGNYSYKVADIDEYEAFMAMVTVHILSDFRDSRVPKKYLSKLCSTVNDFSKLGKSLKADHVLACKLAHLFELFTENRVPKKDVRQFCDALAVNILRDTQGLSLCSIDRIIRNWTSIGASEKHLLEVCENIDFPFLGQQLLEQQEICKIAHVIQNLYDIGVNKDIVFELCELLDAKNIQDTEKCEMFMCAMTRLIDTFISIDFPANKIYSLCKDSNCIQRVQMAKHEGVDSEILQNFVNLMVDAGVD